MLILCGDEIYENDELRETFERAAEQTLLLEGVDPAHIEISLSFVSAEEIKRLNGEYRDKDDVTDVLSFPMFENAEEIKGVPGEKLIGDVVICMDKVKEQAAEYGHSEMREAVYLFVHSILHLLGHDHMEKAEKEEMRHREEEVMDILGLKRGDA